MSFNDFNNKSIFNSNLALLRDKLEGKNIIYSTQYIPDDHDTQCDRDGPTSTWNIEVFCIEKTEDDFIFYFFRSNSEFHYSNPYFFVAKKFYDSIGVKLSDLNSYECKNQEDINNFLMNYRERYSGGFACKDYLLLTENMKFLRKKVRKLKNIQRIYRNKERILREQYEQSEEYKEVIKLREIELQEYKESHEKQFFYSRL